MAANPAAAARRGFHEGEMIKLVLRMKRPAAAHLYETPLSEDQVITDDEREGWVRVEATVCETSQLRWWLLGFGGQVEVLQPEFLREEFRAVFVSDHALYRCASAE